jgi:beta-alanine--pyruvate transaminase
MVLQRGTWTPYHCESHTGPGRKNGLCPLLPDGPPLGFAAAQKLLELAPSDEFQYVFFTNSGSESVDTVMKIVMAYQQHIGNTEKTMIIGRERAYHGVGFGGITVGGLPLNKQHYTLLPDVDHVCHTHNLEHNAFSKGQPEWGEHLADDLLRVIEKHGAEKIAAFITEPVAGSTGVLVPPLGYLKRIREICDKMIFCSFLMKSLLVLADWVCLLQPSILMLSRI